MIEWRIADGSTGNQVSCHHQKETSEKLFSFFYCERNCMFSENIDNENLETNDSSNEGKIEFRIIYSISLLCIFLS